MIKRKFGLLMLAFIFLPGCSSNLIRSDTIYIYPKLKKNFKKNNQNGPDVTYKTIVKNGITFKGHKTVTDKAFARASYVADQMLTNLSYVKTQLEEVNYTVFIIANSQSLTEIPEYDYYKGKTFHQRTAGLRYFDAVTGQAEDYFCAVNENSLLAGFLSQDTMVHEFAHVIHFYLHREDVELIRKAYNNAVNKHLYPMNIYIMENSYEYWAVASQVWFNVGRQSRSSDGLANRQQLIDRDPVLAAIMSRIYGSAEVSMF